MSYLPTIVGPFLPLTGGALGHKIEADPVLRAGREETRRKIIKLLPFREGEAHDSGKVGRQGRLEISLLLFRSR
jgi:hypothetical protein